MNFSWPWLEDFFSIDWGLVQFKEVNFVKWAALFLVAALLLKFLWRYFRKELSYYEHSGYLVERHNKPG